MKPPQNASSGLPIVADKTKKPITMAIANVCGNGF